MTHDVLTSNCCKVWWRCHGDRWGIDVFCFNSLFNQLIQIWRVCILVIVPSKSIKRYEQQLVMCLIFGQRLTAHTKRQNQHQQKFWLHLERMSRRVKTSKVWSWFYEHLYLGLIRCHCDTDSLFYALSASFVSISILYKRLNEWWSTHLLCNFKVK